MIITILLSVSISSLVALLAMIAWQAFALRQGHVEAGSSQSLSAVIQPKIDHAAFHFSTFAGAVLKRFSILLLSGIRVLLLLSKQLIIKLEKRFANIINAVKGKGPTSKKGSVSVFLREVEQYRLEVQSLYDGDNSETAR